MTDKDLVKDALAVGEEDRQRVGENVSDCVAVDVRHSVTEPVGVGVDEDDKHKVGLPETVKVATVVTLAE